MAEHSPRNYLSDPLMGMIADQLLAMKPGDRLPSERLHAESLGVSRTALRDRLSRLESMGVLERRAGAGTYVKEIRPAAAGDSIALGLMASGMPVQALQSVRHALERQAAVEASQRTDHMSLALMAVALDRMDAADSTEALHEADVDFHAALFAASGSPGLVFFSEVLKTIMSHTLHYISLAEDRAKMRTLHRSIYKALVERDPASATLAVDNHFDWLTELNIGKNL